MSERKFKSYTLWLKWRDRGWKPHITCVNLPYPASNPREILAAYMTGFSPSYWRRGKTWMILPENRKPRGYKCEVLT